MKHLIARIEDQFQALEKRYEKCDVDKKCQEKSQNDLLEVGQSLIDEIGLLRKEVESLSKEIIAISEQVASIQ